MKNFPLNCKILSIINKYLCTKTLHLQHKHVYITFKFQDKNANILHLTNGKKKNNKIFVHRYLNIICRTINIVLKFI